MPANGKVSRFPAFPVGHLCALQLHACTRIGSTIQECGGSPRPDMCRVRIRAKWAQRLQIWSEGAVSHDFMRVETRCNGARGCCSWSHKRHRSCIGSHRASLPPLLPHVFAHVLCSNAYTRFYSNHDPPTHPRTSDVAGMDWESEDCFVPTCKRLGTGSVESASVRFFSSWFVDKTCELLSRHSLTSDQKIASSTSSSSWRPCPSCREEVLTLTPTSQHVQMS